ncbi:MAG: HAMP domain-containing histidine kinase [Erysipelotrichales bacterium]|nr:HAMP domain-containing histidine kinase [Erysipelotrichales bacterium]
MNTRTKRFLRRFRFLNPTLWSITTQLFCIIGILFVVFFLLQIIIANILFSNYFIQRQVLNYRNAVNDEIQRVESTADFFDYSFNLYMNKKISSIILDSNLEMYRLESNSYVITVGNREFILVNGLYMFDLGDLLEIHYVTDTRGNHYPAFINDLTSGIQYRFFEAEFYYFKSGSISAINKPTTLNSHFKTDITALSALQRLKTENFTQITALANHASFTDAITSENQSEIFIITRIDIGEETYFLFHFVTILATADILQTLFLYNTYIFILIAFIVFIVSFYLMKIISQPILQISEIATQISNLEFTSIATKKTNKETRILTKSINKLSTNLEKNIQILRDKNQKIEAENLLKKDLVASLSHEMKTPLFIIEATISAILDGVFNEEDYNKELENTLAEIKKTSIMIEETIKIYERETEDFKLEYQVFDLYDLTNEILDSFVNIFKTNNLKVILHEKNINSMMFCDIKQIATVIRNVILNATKYTPSGNIIELSVKENSINLIFEIINYGVQIPTNELTNIFEPFYRIDKSGQKGTKTEGSGLGLFIVKQILNSFDIRFRMDNIKNGVRFRFYYNKESLKRDEVNKNS